MAGPTVTSSGGVQIMGGPAGLTVNPTGAQTTPRYRLNLSVNINNLWNQPAYQGFSGIIISPYFLKPTVAQNLRRITFSTGPRILTPTGNTGNAVLIPDPPSRTWQSATLWQLATSSASHLSPFVTSFTWAIRPIIHLLEPRIPGRGSRRNSRPHQ